jgi:hypothetical protein
MADQISSSAGSAPASDDVRLLNRLAENFGYQAERWRLLADDLASRFGAAVHVERENAAQDQADAERLRALAARLPDLEAQVAEGKRWADVCASHEASQDERIKELESALSTEREARGRADKPRPDGLVCPDCGYTDWSTCFEQVDLLSHGFQPPPSTASGSIPSGSSDATDEE